MGLLKKRKKNHSTEENREKPRGSQAKNGQYTPEEAEQIKAELREVLEWENDVCGYCSHYDNTLGPGRNIVERMLPTMFSSTCKLKRKKVGYHDTCPEFSMPYIEREFMLTAMVTRLPDFHGVDSLEKIKQYVKEVRRKHPNRKSRLRERKGERREI